MRNKNRRRESPPQDTSLVAEKIPLVSVIVPMFNAAKFVTQTLESLLYQTMTDFEVVIVDDCSTDNSIEVVESFRERFNGRLKLVRLPKNTGTPGLPRNVGIQLARGKYISFLDCDDLYTKTALEELSTLAEKFQADGVRLNSNFDLWQGEKKSVDDPAMTNFAQLTDPKNFTVHTYRKEKISEPTLEPNDIAERVRRWVSSTPNAFWATCLTFYRRDFLLANQIFFSKMRTCEDAPFSFKALCLAKKFLNAPNTTYIIRPRDGSVSRDHETIDGISYLRKRLDAFNDGCNEFERIFDEISFFRNRPDYRYAVLEWFAAHRFMVTQGYYVQAPAFRLYEFVKKTFHPDDAALAAFLFNTANVYRLKVMKLQRELAALKNSK